MTPQTIITDARFVVNDTDTTAPRNTDAELLGWVNEGMQEIATFRPDLFAKVGTFTCAAGARQTLTFATATALLEVQNITGGAALTPFNLATLDGLVPSWRSAAAAAAQQWSHSDDPLGFWVYPPASAGQSLDVRYSAVPTALAALTTTITELPETFKPALVDYVVYRAELKDDENVVTARSSAMYQAFLLKIGVKNGGVQEQK